MDLLHLSQNIRSFRQARGMTVEMLAQKSSFSKGFISQVENFRVTPSLGALNKIASALGVSLGELFQEQTESPEYTFGRIDSGEEFQRDDNLRYGIRYFALAFRQPDRIMDPFLIEYLPSNEERDFMMHDTEEFFLLVEGRIVYYLIDENHPHPMKEGDTLYMKANVPHRVTLAPGCSHAKALLVYARSK